MANSEKELYVPDLDGLKAVAAGARPVSVDEAAELLNSDAVPALSLSDVARLVRTILEPRGAEVARLIVARAATLRRQLFGNAVVPMAPVEMANTCTSDCLFCGWRISNRDMKRLRMPSDLLMMQVEYLLDLGIQYIEFVSGDDIVAVRQQLPGLLRETQRLFRRRGIDGKTCFCTLALTEGQYRELRESGADAMIVWQETYDPAVFASCVRGGPKAHGLREDWTSDPSGDGWLFRYQSQERALRAGIEVALGTMIGHSPDIVFEFIATVDHARALFARYEITPEHPLIVGMPIWNPIPTRGADLRPREAPDVGKLFPVFAALYLLALPSAATWVFPNCRVPLHVQVEAARVAGAFTSTSVKLGPGGYLPSVIERMERQGQDTQALRRRLAAMLRDAGDEVHELARALDEREQFIHHYAAHEAYVKALAAAGLRMINGVKVPFPPEDSEVAAARD